MTFDLHKCPAHTRCHRCATSTQHQSSVPQLCLMWSQPGFSPLCGEAFNADYRGLDDIILCYCIQIDFVMFIYVHPHWPGTALVHIFKETNRLMCQAISHSPCLFQLAQLGWKSGDGDFMCVPVSCNNFNAAGFGPSETVRHHCLCCIHSSHGFGFWKRRILSVVCYQLKHCLLIIAPFNFSSHLLVFLN